MNYLKKAKKSFIWLIILSFSIGLLFGMFFKEDDEENLQAALEVIHDKIQNVESEPQPTKTYIGEYIVTAYCSCSKCCGKSDGVTSTGVKAIEGRTIAVDPNVIPYGTEVIIDEHTYVAEDKGGAIKNNRIDIYFDSHEEALNFGKQIKAVHIMKGSDEI